MKILTITMVAAVLTASAAFAQDDLLFDIRHTQSCLLDADSFDDKRGCIGASANLCMGANDLGSSTYGMGGCLSFEAEWWDGQLNAAYKKLMRREKSDDVDADGYGDNIPKKAPALRDMQRAWIPYRDATCAYEYSQWGGGTGGGPASVACVMRLTAEQALYLQDSLTGY